LHSNAVETKEIGQSYLPSPTPLKGGIAQQKES